MEKIIENLKRIVCFVLIVVSASFFAGCKKKKPTGNNEVVTEEETTPATEIIGLAYNNFYSMLNDESTFAEGDGKTFYDEYIFASMSILREVSLLSEIREDTVIFGREVEIQANEENYSDKVAKLYISDKITIKQHQIEMIVFCPRKNYSSEYPNNCIIFYYEIGYNEATKNTKINCKIQKTNQYDKIVGHYCSYEYNSKDKSIIVGSFYKTENIDFSNKDSNVVKAEVMNSIVNFRSLHFSYNDPVQSIVDPQIFDDGLVEYIENTLNYMGDVEDKVSSLGEAELFNEELTEKLIYIVNANDTSFFVDHLSE